MKTLEHVGEYHSAAIFRLQADHIINAMRLSELSSELPISDLLAASWRRMSIGVPDWVTCNTPRELCLDKKLQALLSLTKRWVRTEIPASAEENEVRGIFSNS